MTAAARTARTAGTALEGPHGDHSDHGAHDDPYAELAGRLAAVGMVKRELSRSLPQTCPAGPAAVLSLLGRYGDMRLSPLSELLGVDLSVTSRHVAHVVAHGWTERLPDPRDGRCRILRITPAGRELLDELGSRYSAALRTALVDWPTEDIGTLNTLLTRLRSSF
ncbi:MarR family winged helix-turn-helix transcriptional regulator [Streptomyces sp. NPDC097619]|uniref:MarR family winged helix-turn-helix transcriptional regulator n=1 Tax=Streptomyces sp. NPDC097619 TaxID=3157228 RepID=UPI00332DB6F7